MCDQRLHQPLPWADIFRALSQSLQGLQQASLSSCKCHSKPEPLPKMLGRKNILKTQIFVVLYNFTELIQVKFPWEIWAPGQEQEVVRVTQGHGVLWRDQGKREGLVTVKEEDTQNGCLGRPPKTRGIRSTYEIFGHNLLLGGGTLRDLERPVYTVRDQYILG